MLIEIHMLQNHAPGNLNRDDTGTPKECIFGMVRRARISSQCLKRSIRQSDLFRSCFPKNMLAVRTRRMPIEVAKILRGKGINEELVKIAQVKATGIGNRDGTEQKDGKTAQIMFLGWRDIEAVADAIIAVIEECGSDAEKFEKVKAVDIQKRAELKGYRPITPDIALFGRMITSPAFEDVQAAVQVAHAISTNRVEREFDYFTAVDDLNTGGEDDAGAGMIGDIEFNSACFYKYFSLDVGGMYANLVGRFGRFSEARKEISADDEREARELTFSAIRGFLKAAALVAPSGKQNTFAAHQLPDAILVEVRPLNIPVSYANAFIKPVQPTRDGDLMDNSIKAFKDHAELINEKFSLPATKRLWFSTRNYEIKGAETCKTFNDLITKTIEAAKAGE